MLDYLFSPKSIAVIGASNRPLTIGYRITQNLKDIGFKGPIYPVNPKDPEINGLKAYPSITATPASVDLAHIVVKNTMVPQVMEDCGKKGVKVVIINTAGFKEIGGAGIELEKQIVELGKKYNIRIFGPNCQGVMNTDASNPVYANFTFTQIKPGYISVLAQSGGVGEVINQRLAQLDVGIRMYASNGNAADISIPEIMEYWGKDPDTRVIILHVESLANPQEFIRVAKEITSRKPILGMKTGRTAMGARAVASHTGSLMKADTAIEAVFNKCGIISFKNQEEICQAAIAFASQPIPKGPRVGILTNTGGPAIIATDECIEGGLTISDISDDTKKYLKANLFPEASVNNPVDVLATAGPKEFAIAIEALLKDRNIDSILINFVTPFFVDCAGVAKEMSAKGGSASGGKPIIINLMTDKKQWAETLEIIKSSGIPAYDLAETAAKALVAMTKYGEYKKRIENQSIKVSEPKDINKEATKEIINNARKSSSGSKTQLHLHPVRSDESTENKSGQSSVSKTLDASNGAREFLSLGEALGVLYNYKIPAAKFVIADRAEDILTSAEYVGYPLVLKLDAPDIIHKTEKEAVILNITAKEKLVEAIDKIKRTTNYDPRTTKFMLQEYLTGGREVIIGANYMENLGHLIMFGLGGIFVEVLKDVAFAINPLNQPEALQMIQSIKGYKILEGVRNQKGVAIDKLLEIILRTSQLLKDCPEIKELDLNPVMLYPEANKCKVVDVRIKI